ncbi:hypothetical protein [Arundinibacter roseus]|uniref:DUF4304 domain-containing protein n=1 Tax=Arundinibacter roseus TaxID=2070510 RepID=A0A4V2X9N6_9BACT|nr:hypothetical protein [Arundinibacter roseus]TDB64565.1 hypothetical protein EZE20_12895 [Arundinibacter roseus]
MDLSSFEKKLFTSLEDFFTSHNFPFYPTPAQFRRSTVSGFDNVIFSFSPYQEALWVDVFFGNRFETVEQIAQQFLTNRLDFRPDANTLLTTIGRFRQRTYFHYKLKNQSDFDAACADITTFFVEKGFAFFELVGTLSELDSILNDFPEQRCAYVANATHRAFKGLIAARLAQNPRFEKLYDFYKKELADNYTDQPTQISFEKLHTFLQYYSHN